MAYRDPIAAARARLTEAQENVAALEERVTPALIEQLPDKLAARLERASAKANDAIDAARAPRLPTIREAVKVLGKLEDLLEEAIQRAPKLARKFNRLPRAFPQRVHTRYVHTFPDIYSTAQLSLRKSLHADIDAMDAKARLFDRRAGYINSLTRPYLVEACFRIDWVPLRLQVSTRQLDVQRTTGYHVELITSFCMVTGVRPSTPEMVLTPDTMRKDILTMLGLARDVELDNESLDAGFSIDADPEDAKRVLRPEVQTALVNMMQVAEVHLVEVKDELARIEWQEDVTIKVRWGGQPVRDFASNALSDAIDVLVGIRKTPPTPLLRQLKRRGGKRRR